MATSVNSALFGLSDTYESLIANLITLESTRKFAIEDQVTEQQSRKSAISSVGSKLTSFNRTLVDFASPANNLFDLYAATSSNEAAFTVSNTSKLTTSGSFNVEVQQIAKADVRVSAQFSAAGTDIATAVNSVGGDDELDFDITVNGNTYNITIGDITGLTNEDVLQAVVDEINSNASDDVQATILRETSGTVRLSIRSKESGQDAAISFSNTIDADGQTNLAEVLQLTVDNGGLTADDNGSVLAPASLSGGRLFALGTLDAQFTIDGLSFVRSSNVVSDAITGLSLTLKQTTSATETISIESDTASALDNINTFISSFNGVVSEIRSQTYLNGTSGERGPLYKDRSFRELSYTLRQNLISTALDTSIVVGGTPSNPIIPGGVEIQTILDIGLNVRQDGSLYIEDQSKLEEVLRDNPNAVKTLFSSDRTDGYSGIAGKLQDSIDLFIKADGLVTSLTTSIDERIAQLNKRIEVQDEYLARRETQLRNQFIQLQALADEATSQYQTIASIGSYYS
ncbi:hypothetical protein EP331_14970 [bacterium]|nr:MAG: hypothetical protein EP331_14970 [bacterium]